MTTPTTPQDRATEPNLLTATRDDLVRWFFNDNAGISIEDTLVLMRDAIVRQALATRPVSARALSDADIEDAWDCDGAADPDGTPWADLDHNRAVTVGNFARRIAALGASSSPDADALTAAKREGWNAARDHHYPPGALQDAIWRMGRHQFDTERDRRYPIAPSSVMLSDGSVVTYDSAPKCKGFPWIRTVQGCAHHHHHWFACLNHMHTGADFDALKQFAATLSPTGAER